LFYSVQGIKGRGRNVCIGYKGHLLFYSVQGIKGRGRKSPKKKNKESNASVKERRDSDNSSRSANESTPTEKPEKKRGKDLEKKRQAAEQSEDMTVCR
jgi:hypothetical protein